MPLQRDAYAELDSLLGTSPNVSRTISKGVRKKQYIEIQDELRKTVGIMNGVKNDKNLLLSAEVLAISNFLSTPSLTHFERQLLCYLVCQGMDCHLLRCPESRFSISGDIPQSD